MLVIIRWGICFWREYIIYPAVKRWNWLSGSLPHRFYNDMYLPVAMLNPSAGILRWCCFVETTPSHALLLLELIQLLSCNIMNTWRAWGSVEINVVVDINGIVLSELNDNRYVKTSNPVFSWMERWCIFRLQRRWHLFVGCSQAARYFPIR